MEIIKILTKLLVVKREITSSQYDQQAILNGDAVEVLDEVIDEVLKEVEIRQQYEDECG
jgi:glycerol-3-phosphate responsive antiterminator